VYTAQRCPWTVPTHSLTRMQTRRRTALGLERPVVRGSVRPFLTKRQQTALSQTDVLRLAPASISTTYTWIDPAAEGANPEVALVTVARDDGKQPRLIVLLRSAAACNKDKDLHSAIRRHLEAVRRLPCVAPKALLVVGVDVTYGGKVLFGSIRTAVQTAQDERETADTKDVNASLAPLRWISAEVGQGGIRVTATVQDAAWKGLKERVQAGHLRFLTDADRTAIVEEMKHVFRVSVECKALGLSVNKSRMRVRGGAGPRAATAKWPALLALAHWLSVECVVRF